MGHLEVLSHRLQITLKSAVSSPPNSFHRLSAFSTIFFSMVPDTISASPGNLRKCKFDSIEFLGGAQHSEF